MSKQFTLDDKEEQTAKDWIAEHKQVCNLRPGSCGDLYQYHFTPSGLGSFPTIHCPCGAECELYDINLI